MDDTGLRCLSLLKSFIICRQILYSAFTEVLHLQENSQEGLFFFNWSIVDLQCVHFFCAAYVFFFYFFCYGLSQDIEYSSLCYTAGSCLSSTLHLLTPSSHSISCLFPLALGNNKVCSLCLWVCFRFVDEFLCVIF